MKRPSKDKYYLEVAKAISLRCTCLKRQYGCVIVKNDVVKATGYNGAPRGEENCCDIGICKRMDKPHNSGDYSDCPSVHAEQNAMISASREDMIGATMYIVGHDCYQYKIVDATPCPICMRMIKNAGIKRIVNEDKEYVLY